MSEYLYHGTSESGARRALKRGILPREMSGKGGNWKHTVQSNPSMVYLTAAYAPYFAFCATDTDKECIAIIQVDPALLDEARLYPDEDFVERALRKELTKTVSVDMMKRTRYVRRNISIWRHCWRLSLDGLGNVAYKGAIPPEAIVKIIACDPQANPYVSMTAFDPTITVENYRFCGEKYRALTRWYMGEEVDAATVCFGALPVDQQAGFFAERLNATREQLANRSGLETIAEKR